MYGLFRGTVRLLAHVYLAGLLSICGLDGLPRSGPYLVCANHIGTIDPALLPAFVNRDDSWSMAKAESLATPGIGSWVLRTYHGFGVVRHTADRRALRRARGVLAEGGVLFMYPEGHRGWDGRLQRAEPGAAFLARAARVPVVPVGIVGTNECLPQGARFPRRRRVELRFGDPLLLRERLEGRGSATRRRRTGSCSRSHRCCRSRCTASTGIETASPRTPRTRSSRWSSSRQPRGSRVPTKHGSTSGSPGSGAPRRRP